MPVSGISALLSRVREPIALSFCALSLLVLVFALVAPDKMALLVLYPPYALGRGYVWQFATYAFFPVNGANFLIVCSLMLWFVWHIEPILGPLRCVVLYLGAALASGLAYGALEPTAPSALAGGQFVVSAAGTAFLVWSIPSRSKLGWKLKLFWCIAALWAAFVVLASPVYLVVMHLLAWGVGVIVALAPLWLKRTPSNKPLQATQRSGVPER
jgi:hypothetical protein